MSVKRACFDQERSKKIVFTQSEGRVLAQSDLRKKHRAQGATTTSNNMSSPSAWNCFAWRRNRKQLDGERKLSPKKHLEPGPGDGSADEQFLNLLGGECFA